ncbi:MAG: hypothetical protein ACXU82_12060 [Caulobacteraceae bacterium]
MTIISEAANKNDCRGSLRSGRLAFKDFPQQSLEHDQKWTISLDDYPALDAIKELKPRSLSLSVILSYQPFPPLPFRRSYEFKFETRAAADGRLYWFSLPIEAAPTPQEYAGTTAIIMTGSDEIKG